MCQSKRIFVNRTKAIVMAALMASALIVNIFSSTINDSLDRPINSDDGSGDLVGLQPIESWPVLRIEFPGKAFPTNVDEGFFQGSYSAQNYIEQISGSSSSLDVTFIEGVWESPSAESHWGSDSEHERDTGSGSGGARQLAANAINYLMEDADLSKWDLDGDGTVDRLLILHSGEAQELGGKSSSIWSHFSTFTEPPKLNGYTFEHYTMASIHGGIRVVVHEMLHQMGAVDLYDVHSDTPSRSWHGLGDWDVMSSGNWIDDGNTPSLPSSTTLDLIGAIDPYTILEIDQTNPDAPLSGNIGEQEFTGEWAPGSGMAASFTLAPIPDGGVPLKIWIGPGEYLWITFRATDGFDSGIPGHGIIVEQQDWNFGSIEENLVNTDPSKPWVRIIEADGDDALMRARDYGSAGDAFIQGDSFGNRGHEIWDNTGKLVSFSINVTNMTEDHATIEYYIPYRSFTLTMPRNPIVMLSGEEISASVAFYDVPCNFTIDLDTEGIPESIIVDGQGLPVTHSIVLANSSLYSSNAPGTGSISGTVGCDGQESIYISLNWKMVSHRISEESLSARIKWDVPSDVHIYPDSYGTGEMTYSASITGAADRVATVSSQLQFSPGEPIEIRIDPDGLLEPGMIARGELVLVSSMNIEYRIPIVLQSDSEFPLLDNLEWLSVPSNAITVVFMILALSVATAARTED